MTTGPAGDGIHRVTFRGAVDHRPLLYRDGDLVLVDRAGAALAPSPPGARTSPVTLPPSRVAVEAATELVRAYRPPRVVAAGDGGTLDVAKQAWLDTGSGPLLVLAPLGAEPWRAFAPFTSLYEPDGQRFSRPDRAVATARVIVDPAALARRPDLVVALHSADSTVHAVELLLHTAAQPWSRALAKAGLAALATGRPGDDVVGAGLITEAFAGAGLGLAHAVASPLGAAAGRTHDRPNVIVAPYVVRHYRERVDWSTVAAALGVAANAGAVANALAGRRDRAGLPASLRAAGFTQQQVRAVVPAALRSSGIPFLPVATDAADIGQLLERAWAGE